MSNPVMSIIDCATGVVETREMTDQEYTDFLASLPENPFIPGAESADQ